MTEVDDLLIGTVEAAQVLGVDPATVVRLVHRQELSYVRKMPGQTGTYLFSARVVRRKAQERLLRRHERQQAKQAS